MCIVPKWLNPGWMPITSLATLIVNYMQKEYPELAIDGEMQVNFAMNRELRDAKYPFNQSFRIRMTVDQRICQEVGTLL